MRSLIRFGYSMRIYPHLQDTGGFFVAVLQRKAEEDAETVLNLRYAFFLFLGYSKLIIKYQEPKARSWNTRRTIRC